MDIDRKGIRIRFITTVDYLIDKGFASSKKEIADILNLKPSALSEILNRRTYVGAESIGKLCYQYNVNIDFIFKGEGKIILGSKNESFMGRLEIENKPIAQKQNHATIPLVNITAVGGFGNGQFAIAERDIKDRYVIPKFEHKKIDFMIEVEGSSMQPKYNSGDVVACRIIKERQFIQWNKVHVLASKSQGILIKRIQQSTNDSCLLMVSDNQTYAPFNVPEEDIEGVALVVGVVRVE